MTDTLSAVKRSWNMSKIKGFNSKPEIKVRSFLHSQGLRFRNNVKNLPGKPDIVLKKYNSTIFVDGCFWHRHKNCKYAYNPKSRIDFWQKKFRDNIKRDKIVNNELSGLGWRIFRIWECEINEKGLKNLLDKIKN